MVKFIHGVEGNSVLWVMAILKMSISPKRLTGLVISWKPNVEMTTRLLKTRKVNFTSSVQIIMVNLV